MPPLDAATAIGARAAPRGGAASTSGAAAAAARPRRRAPPPPRAASKKGGGGKHTPALLPAFLPAEFAAEIEEPAAVAMMGEMRRAALAVPGLGEVLTAYVHRPATGAAAAAAAAAERPAFVLLHGFDSSLLEFRRFYARLAELGDVYAVDLAGWGFTDAGFGLAPARALGPPEKRAHLRAFLDGVVGRPATLLGTSLGGAVALDFALAHPARVSRLVLVDAQGFIDGVGPMAALPRPLAALGVGVLRSEWLRQMANRMAYHDTATFATADAMRVGRLHTHLPGWTDANVAFMQSGGYPSVAGRLGAVAAPALVVWGRQDGILSPDYAARFIAELPDARLAWVESCGPSAHLEQPEALLDAVRAFVAEP
jgi:pimeloyl-ACP methyl ester carboxylesterase